MINIAIVEDNLHHLMRLETILYDLSKEMHIKINIVSSASIKEYQSQLSEKTVYDLYFLDLEIDNNKNKGFEL
ncbi:DNA-binding response regulator, partial [Enterococcus faecalis]|nr:DNA-binding response regulator [Enterococcus faecalis]